MKRGSRRCWGRADGARASRPLCVFSCGRDARAPMRFDAECVQPKAVSERVQRSIRRQRGQRLAEMLSKIPTACDRGAKQKSLMKN
jgi:hypothetical protein